jgi:hypothetical protein
MTGNQIAAVTATGKNSHTLTAAKAAFPNLIDGQVYHCGYHAASSFGAASYLIRRPQGNVLIDSPRFTTPLVRRLEELGGVRLMVLSHCDDVADHRRFRAHFGCERVMHRDDVEVGTADVDIQIAGRDVVALDEELLFIPVPGHIRRPACSTTRPTCSPVIISPGIQSATAFRLSARPAGTAGWS